MQWRMKGLEQDLLRLFEKLSQRTLYLPLLCGYVSFKASQRVEYPPRVSERAFGTFFIFPYIGIIIPID